MKVDIDNFDEWLKDEMDKSSISTSELSRASGVTQQSICGYKRGARIPTLSAFEALAAALGYRLEMVKES